LKGSPTPPPPPPPAEWASGLPSARSAATAVAITAGLVVLCAICCLLVVDPCPIGMIGGGQRRRLHPVTPHGVDFSACATPRRESRMQKPSKSGEIGASRAPVSPGQEAKRCRPRARKPIALKPLRLT